MNCGFNFVLLLCGLKILFVSSFSGFADVFKEEWETFKIKFNKNYERKIVDDLRFRLFTESKMTVAEHNQKFYEGFESHLIEINFFSDLFPHEWSQYKGFKPNSSIRPSEGATFIEPHEDVIFPKSIDWRTHGAVTPVKNQGHCGSCWAFSAVGALEGQHFRKTHKLVSLSEQNLVDCVVSMDGRKENCDGGIMPDAYNYVKKNHGIDTEKSYPYTAKNGKCHFSNGTIGATDKGFVLIKENDERALMKAVATKGPISVAIDASQESFVKYKTGIYHDKNCSPTNLDHGVLVVGYGTENGVDYWLVKNSWSEKWGHHGYIKMIRNNDNHCGIATAASYPLV